MTRKNGSSRRKRAKDPNVYPPGWNYQRVQKIIKYYDGLKDQPLLPELRMSNAKEMVWMEVPEALVPKVQKLIVASRKSA
jgi:hypothetical protein